MDTVFTADHILSIQQLCCQYLLEYERKQDIYRSIVACHPLITSASSAPEICEKSDDSNDKSDDDSISPTVEEEEFNLPWISSGQLDHAISAWSDRCEESYIDVEDGKEICAPTIHQKRYLLVTAYLLTPTSTIFS